jgi:hypothetical protein
MSSDVFRLFASFVDQSADCVGLFDTDNAATNRAASSSTSLNTKRLDEDTENLAREFSVTLLVYFFFFHLGRVVVKILVLYMVLYT